MATAKKITIHDVALAAGVSVSTVSLVLSGKGRISTATGERVNAAIEELGFVRNRQASALRGGQSGVIGLIVRDLSAPFYAELTAGLTEALEAQGRMVFLLHGGKDGEQLAQRFSLLLNQGVDGVVIAGAAGSSDDLRRIAEEKAIPVIFASRASYLDDVDTVRPDNMQAAQLLTEHLIRNGHQRIAWLGGQSSSLTRAERVGGYCATLLKILACRFTAIGCWSALPARSKPRKLSRRFYVITRPSAPWFAITKLLRWGHGLVC
ncbi:maltose regulon regulatory protein MalI [Escherichia coli TA206]|nr:maltose regulon regulatory protein MalI [Escherichia coli TA206]